MRKSVTSEQFEELINRLFPKGYVVNELEDEEKMYCDHAGFFYVDKDLLDHYIEPILKVWLSDDQILSIACLWEAYCMDLGEIQDMLDNIITEVIPDMVLIPKTQAPDVSNIKKGGLYHEFVYYIPSEKEQND